ncbi:Alpha-glucosidase [Thermoplasmatales archaeon]|nr:Alpha-glucosidase [Thermoplasmatales archaeon]
MQKLSNFEISSVFSERIYRGIGKILEITHKNGETIYHSQFHSVSIKDLGNVGMKITFNAGKKDYGLSVPHKEPKAMNNMGSYRVKSPKKGERFQINIMRLNRTVLSSYSPGDQLGFLNLGDEVHDMFCTDEKNEFTTISFRIPTEYGIYGLGENFTTFNKRGKVLYTFPADNYLLFASQVYKGIPFFLSNAGLGIVFPRYEPIKFDFGQTIDGLIMISIPSTSFEFYILYGTPIEIVQNFVSMFDKPQMPPKWSFGLWWSRWIGIGPQSVNQVAEVVDKFTKEQIPLDVVVIDPQWLKGYIAGVTQACSFDWDHNKFMTDNAVGDLLESRGKKLALWINPYIEFYGTGYEKLKHCFLKDKTGKTALVPVQDGNPNKPNRGMVDFTRPDCAEVYISLVADLMKRSKARTVISDFGETVPPDAIDEYGNPGYMIRNKLGDLYQIAAFDGVKRGTGEGIIWGRSGSLRSHNLPIKWGGDSNSTWEGMKTALRAALTASVSGAIFSAFDIGGFAGKPDKKLFLRWSAAAALFSYFKLQGTTEREPWAYDQETVNDFRELSELRYRLIHYILDEAEKSIRDYIPLVRPLLMAFPEDPNAANIDDEFMLGSDILVAPILTEDEIRSIYIPEGDWVYYYNGERTGGGKWVTKQEGFNRVPLFVRKGARIKIAVGRADNLEEYLKLPTQISEF